jgi:hypothetical protein
LNSSLYSSHRMRLSYTPEHTRIALPSATEYLETYLRSPKIAMLLSDFLPTDARDSHTTSKHDKDF